MLFSCLPGRRRPSTPNREVLLSSGEKHANPAGSTGTVFSATAQEGPSRYQSGKGIAARIRLPITAQILSGIHGVLHCSANPEKVALWAIASVAFFGFFQLGELLLASANQFNAAINLSWGDVAVDDRSNPSMIKIHLKQSKCNQFRKGVDVIVGRTYCDICPVAAILRYIALSQDHPGPLFLDRQHKPITERQFVSQIREHWVSPSMNMLDTALELGRTPRDQLTSLSWHLADQVQSRRPLHKGNTPSN